MPTSFANGRYQVLGFLGEGGKKTVYRAHDTLLDRDVAFALMRTDGLDAAGRERVQREAQALGRLGSPHIVSVFDLGEDDGHPFIVSEFLPGGDLDHLIRAAPDHRLPLARVLELGVDIAKGLAVAHEHGVVHRDLKPGNVLLAADGTPKLADFGLAVALDQSRLTQAGMIVGTAAYLAPEQAMGGEVTPRSDLYSLGCLLYELVTGRPPFVGDDSVAIIGQHLHANPIAPSWSRPDVPKALETLILRLLEKDPSKRSASAQQVVESLAGINPTAKRSTSEARRLAESSGPSPVYRRIFVGREAELQQLEAAFDAAQSGQGGLAMVVGEPGIGKTSLTEQLATYATLRGGKTLVGHCYEEGSLSLPYLPFVEALRTYVLDREPTKLKSELGSNGPEVARIVSEVRERAQVEPADPSADPGEDRYRLLQAVSSFLRNAAAVQPLVLVLEDLHDADRGTLDLLTFLARQLQGARLLIVGTYRDVEVDRQHPLSATLAELRRASNFSRVLLRGLTADEVQRMLSAIAGQDVPWSLAEGVHRQTEGNPLFVQEVMRYLAEEGLIKRDGGRWQANAGVTLLDNIPEGLRDVIGRRLSRLSADCNRVLTVAAVIGREFDLATLVGVSGEGEERVVDLLDEAVRVAVLQEQAKVGALRYRFAHAFFRQTLYEELSAARRLRLHQQIARVLEQQYAGRLSEHAAELAEHFTQSTDSADLRKAVEYSRIAAERATSVYAHGEAQRLLEQALEVQEVLDPGDRAAVCDLLIALGNTLIFSSNPLRAADEIAPRAFELAEALGDDDRAATVSGIAMDAMGAHAAGDANQRPEYRQWAERMNRYAKEGTALRIRADMALHGVATGRARTLEAWEHGQRALAQARALGDAQLLSLTAGRLVNGPGDVRHFPERLRLLDEFAGQPEIADAATTGESSVFLLGASLLCFDWGQRERWEALSRRNLAVMERRRSARLPAFSVLQAATLAFVEGDLAGAVEQGYEFRKMAEALGAAGWGQLYGEQALWRPLLYLARYEDVLEASRSLAYARVVCLAHMGRLEEAREALRAQGVLRRVLRGDEESYSIVLSPLLEAAALTGDAEVAAVLDARCAVAGAAPPATWRSAVALGCLTNGVVVSRCCSARARSSAGA
ncbi:MAG TPA: AAA family ATPase, partial [Chloroflexota bacterium]